MKSLHTLITRRAWLPRLPEALRAPLRHRGALHRASAALLAAALAGCAVGPNYRTPNVAVPGRYDAPPPSPGTRTSAASPSGVDLATWWSSLHDPQLDSLVQQAVNNNPSVLIALDRLQAARLYEAGLTGVVAPAVDASVGYGRGTGSDLTKGLAGEPLRSADTSRGLNSVTTVGGFDAVWEIDIFGKFRREIEQARYDTQIAADVRNAVLVSVVADVASSYVDLRALQMRAAVLQDASQALSRGVTVVTQRFQQGITNELDVQLARRELGTINAQIPIVNAEVSSGIYAISTLLGEYPEDLVTQLSKPGMLPIASASVPVGLPADLLRRRPDLQEAEREIARANAGIGIVTADLFPQVIATGSIGFQQGLLGTATVGQHIWSAGPGVIWPLLDFGQLDARVQIANIQTRAALENYKDAVETAVRQVDTAAAQFDGAQSSLASLGDALVASQRAVTLANQRYNRGLTDYLNVVDAESAEYTIQEQYVDTQRSIDERLVELYRDLGGGWQAFQDVPAISRPLPAIIAIFKDTLGRTDPLKDP